MNKTLRIVVPGVAVAAMAASLTACGAGSANGNDANTLVAGGSSAQKDVQGVWTTNVPGGKTVTYDATQGSGNGRTKFISGEYAFAGSDSALKNDADKGTHELDDATAHCGGIAPIEVPVYVSPIAIVFNVPGVKSLTLDAATIANIFNGTITSWNAPAIKALNPTAALPSTAIQTVHRSDNSGTSNNLTDFLYKASGGAWKDKASGDWPAALADKGLTGANTADMVKALGTAGTIGYIDGSKVTDAMTVVSIKGDNGVVAPSAASAEADVLASSLKDPSKTTEIVFSVERQPKAAGAYPITLVSYAIACADYSKAGYAAGVGDLVKSYLTYALSAQGQAAATAKAKSAQIPATYLAKAQQVVAGIK